MRMAFWQRLIALAVLMSGISLPARAAQFEQQEIDQSRFIVLAAPGGDIGYKLLILEQLKDSRPCWNETGSNPSQVEPLLLSFDFTGICNRIVDSNGFSVRTAEQDQALLYSLRILPQGNDLVLVAASNTDRDVQIELGRTNGVPNGFSRIVLNPGWRLTRRAYNGQPVGHIYLTYDQPIEYLATLQRSGRYPAPTGNLNHSNDAAVDRLEPENSVSPDLPPAILPPATTPPAVLPPAITPPEPSPAGTPEIPPESVIPVPSLPPAATSTPLPDRPTPPLRPILPPVAPGAAPPSLSSILPPPTPTPAAVNAPARSDRPLSSRNNSSTSATGGPTATPQSIATEGNTGSSNAGSSNAAMSNAGSSNTGSSNTGSSSTTARTTSTRPPTSSSSQRVTTSRVPTASNSGGAALRPPVTRRQTAATNNAQTSNTQTSSPESSTVEPVATAQAETYQVIVVADSAESQDTVKAIAPNAFLTTINGQVVMQVGLFRDRAAAERLQQRLSAEGLPTAVIPVR